MTFNFLKVCFFDPLCFRTVCFVALVRYGAPTYTDEKWEVMMFCYFFFKKKEINIHCLSLDVYFNFHNLLKSKWSCSHSCNTYSLRAHIGARNHVGSQRHTDKYDIFESLNLYNSLRVSCYQTNICTFVSWWPWRDLHSSVFCLCSCWPSPWNLHLPLHFPKSCPR